VKMDKEDEAFVLFMPPDFPVDDLYEAAEILLDASIFVPGYVPPEVGLYEPRGFLYEMHALELETVVLPDRNVASRLAQVIQGKPITGDHQRRVAAAMMAFAQCLDIQIEPSIAFHELASVQGNDVALKELAWFRAADNPPRPHDWLDVAIGRSERMADCIDAKDLPAEIAKRDLAKPLHRWRKNYILALKIAELELTPMCALERVLTFFEWMYRDFILGGPAALLASIYFAPNSPPRKGLFKELRSPDRERAIRGVQNAAWDLTHLSDFIERVTKSEEQQKRYLFASFDAGLRLVAEMLFEYQLHPSERGTMVIGLERWWPNRDAQRIAGTLFGYYDQGRSPEWFEQQKGRPGYIDELIAAGEGVIRQPMGGGVPVGRHRLFDVAADESD
jgi:hypothetical protein